MRRIFGPKNDANGEWRRLHNEEIHSLYRSPNIIRVSVEERRNVFKILTGIPAGKRLLGRPKRTSEDNTSIIMDP